MPRDLIGEFEQMVLLAILRLDDQAYGVPIVEEIEERTGRRPADAAVYTVLHRLEVKGHVTSEMADASDERGGRRRRYYRLEPTGLAELRAARHRMLRLWEGLEDALEEGG